MMASTAKTALILGATGVVGRHCLDELLLDATYAHVVAIGRRACGQTHPKLTEIVTPLDAIADVKSTELGRINDVFCCLGTTQKTAGSADTFRHVEVDYPRAAARLAKANGASHFLIITAIGADARSPIFYNKVKGEVEAAVIAEGLAHTSIFRPSLLLSERAEFRWKEKLSEPFMRVLGVIMIGPARRLRPIHAQTVARAMVRVAGRPQPGVTIYPSDRIADIGAARA
jgi:uncharacterized protein YbjT (DUF2867 family)